MHALIANSAFMLSAMNSVCMVWAFRLYINMPIKIWLNENVARCLIVGCTV